MDGGDPRLHANTLIDLLHSFFIRKLFFQSRTNILIFLSILRWNILTNILGLWCMTLLTFFRASLQASNPNMMAHSFLQKCYQHRTHGWCCLCYFFARFVVYWENGRIMYGLVKIWSCIVFTNFQHKLYSFFKSQPGNFTLDIIVKYIIIKRSLEWLGFRISDYWLGHKKAFNLLFCLLKFFCLSLFCFVFFICFCCRFCIFIDRFPCSRCCLIAEYRCRKKWGREFRQRWIVCWIANPIFHSVSTCGRH